MRLLKDGYFIWPALSTAASLGLTLESAIYFDVHGLLYHSVALIFVSIISLMFFAGCSWFAVMVAFDAKLNYPEFYIGGTELPIIEFPRMQIRTPVEQPELEEVKEEARIVTVKSKNPKDLKDLGEALLKHKHGEVIE